MPLQALEHCMLHESAHAHCASACRSCCDCGHGVPGVPMIASEQVMHPPEPVLVAKLELLHPQNDEARSTHFASQVELQHQGAC